MHVVSSCSRSCGVIRDPFSAFGWADICFLVMNLISLWQFAYLAVAIPPFYLSDGRWGNRLLSVAATMVIYLLNAVFMTAVQVGRAAVALAFG